MKKLLVMLVAMGLMAGTANAATLWMQFEGGGTEVTLEPSDFVNVEIWIDLVGGSTTPDNLVGVNFPNWPQGTADAGAYPNAVEGLVQTTVAASQAGWLDNSLNGVIGGFQNLNIFAGDPFTQGLMGGGSYLIGVQTIHQNDITLDDSGFFGPGFEYEFYPVMFGGDPNTATTALDEGNVSYEMAFDPGYAAYTGYLTWGQGGSAISGKATSGAYDLPDNPLKVYCIPEPASLALLALGGLAIIRRR